MLETHHLGVLGQNCGMPRTDVGGAGAIPPWTEGVTRPIGSSDVVLLPASIQVLRPGDLRSDHSMKSFSFSHCRKEALRKGELIRTEFSETKSIDMAICQACSFNYFHLC